MQVPSPVLPSLGAVAKINGGASRGHLNQTRTGHHETAYHRSPFRVCAPAAALAEIKLSGQAAMGLALHDGKTDAVSDLQLTLHGSRVTDGGVEFGAVVDLNQSPSRVIRSDPPRAYVYMSTGNFSIGAGNTVPTAGLNGASKRSHFGF